MATRGTVLQTAGVAFFTTLAALAGTGTLSALVGGGVASTPASPPSSLRPPDSPHPPPSPSAPPLRPPAPPPTPPAACTCTDVVVRNVEEFSDLVLHLTTPGDALSSSITLDADRMAGNPLGGSNVYAAEMDGKIYGVYFLRTSGVGAYHIKRTAGGNFGYASQFRLDLSTGPDPCPFGRGFVHTGGDFGGLSPVQISGNVTVECAVSPPSPPRVPGGTAACPCLEDYPAFLLELLGDSPALTVDIEGVLYDIPRGYGLGCLSHDAGGAPPFCHEADPPAWCPLPWCFVVASCAGATEAYYFPGLNYSYDTCSVD